MLWNLTKPILVKVHGYCLAGGTDLALNADMIVSTEDAEFGFPANGENLILRWASRELSSLADTAMRHDVEILRVLTTHNREPVETGTATVAYFPNGFVERSLIWIGMEDGMVLTLSIDPMTGRVFIYPEDLEVPEDFFEVEEESASD